MRPARPSIPQLRVAPRRSRGAKAAEEHSLNLAEKMPFRLRSIDVDAFEMAAVDDRSDQRAES